MCVETRLHSVTSVYILYVCGDKAASCDFCIQSNLRTTAMHGDEPFGLCREFDLISEFFGLDEDLVDPE